MMATDKKAEAATAKAVVAHGRTVVGFDGKSVSAGGEVTLLASEVDHLASIGFLVQPGVEEVPRGNGPSFGSNEGPRIQVA